MTNTEAKTSGAHRTEASSGTVEGTSDHPRGHCTALVGEINARSWTAQAAAARSDAAYRRDLRAVLRGGR